jgi:hypothetical protein
MTKRELNRLARKWARIAHSTEYFPAWGIFAEEYHEVIVLFHNWPRDHCPDLHRQKLAEVREYLRDQGIKELAYAAYPREGRSYALVLSAALVSHKALVKRVERILRGLVPGQEHGLNGDY